ncbi:hypothetical protein KM043_017842 [Ampulex compressa]|nr:hypothetical protein KM043_017842 [Ampulex compressa]
MEPVNVSTCLVPPTRGLFTPLTRLVPLADGPKAVSSVGPLDISVMTDNTMARIRRAVKRVKRCSATTVPMNGGLEKNGGKETDGDITRRKEGESE